MKRIFLVIFALLLLAACARENSSTVSFSVDAAGCLIGANDFDSTGTTSTTDGFTTTTFTWECADYVNIPEDIDVREKKVTLIFTGVGCLELASTLIFEGFCLQGKTPTIF